jgi:uncharacterized protein
MSPLLFTGLALGIVFGFALQRGRFCMNSAFRDVIVLKDYDLLKAVGVALLVSMVGFQLMAMAGIITLNPKPLLWGANIFGGLIFGIGMVLAGGCASGITYRAGEGMVGAMAAIAGYSLTGLMAAIGLFKPLVTYLQDNTKIAAADGSTLTLANAFGLPHYILAFGIPILAIVLWYFFGRSQDDYADDSGQNLSLGERIFKHAWGWRTTGIVIGLIGMAAFPLSAATGRNYPLGITGGWVGFSRTLVTGQNFISWEVLLVLGIVVGGFIAAIIAGEFALRAPEPKMMLQSFGGGLLMGFGAVCASGCNVGHILSGVPQLSMGSIASGISIILGAWFAAYFLFIRPQQAAVHTAEHAAHART